ncbi:MAG: prephenate dehydratase [Elusimicrobia bacterium]|jgi:chorismate mutase/prephenate dehydratase|nr:prephenate dehydratase [Elusimicrobiota bacterium]
MENIRKKIDAIDSKLLDLLDSRAGYVRKLGAIKESKGASVFVPEREESILNKIKEQSSAENVPGKSVPGKNVSGKNFPVEGKINIFKEIFAVSRSLQKDLIVSYLGPEATFTHMAAVKQFSEHCLYIPASSIDRVFREVEKKRADYGVVPVENSTEGAVSHTLDVFMESDCKITSEILMDISHNLLSKENSIDDIKTIYSHPQAFGQCGIWLEENLAGVEHIELSSTSAAAQRAASQDGTAAIASSVAADLYELNTLAEGIEDARKNVTRFYIIGNKMAAPSKNSKTTVMFSTKDKVGALHDMLVPFKQYSINLTKIESRPSGNKVSGNKTWEYMFFVDLEGHITNGKVKKALDELKKDCVFFKVLGSYPAAQNLD